MAPEVKMFKKEDKKLRNIFTQMLTEKGKQFYRNRDSMDVRSMNRKSFWKSMSEMFDNQKGPQLIDKLNGAEMDVADTIEEMTESEMKIVKQKSKGLIYPPKDQP